MTILIQFVKHKKYCLRIDSICAQIGSITIPKSIKHQPKQRIDHPQFIHFGCYILSLTKDKKYGSYLQPQGSRNNGGSNGFNLKHKEWKKTKLAAFVFSCK